jgi:hypothetical protein
MLHREVRARASSLTVILQRVFLIATATATRQRADSSGKEIVQLARDRSAEATCKMVGMRARASLRTAWKALKVKA